MRAVSECHGPATGITDSNIMNVRSAALPGMQVREPVQVRAQLLSDLHLGPCGCQAEKLLDFFRDYKSDPIYLIGDIADGRQLKSGWYWPQSHNDVVQKLLRKARKGDRVVYMPANHDESCSNSMAPRHFGGDYRCNCSRRRSSTRSICSKRTWRRSKHVHATTVMQATSNHHIDQMLVTR